MYRVVRFKMQSGPRTLICFTVLHEREINDDDVVVSRKLESEEEGWNWLEVNPLSAWDRYMESGSRR